ncbi:hypothetical protein [Gemmiger sp.]|nr:hypothetical protein [Gemmiger sp.]MDY4448854.1 hypothetical protein [Gemmiger sp.]
MLWRFLLWLNRKEVDELKASAAKECGYTPADVESAADADAAQS